MHIKCLLARVLAQRKHSKSITDDDDGGGGDGGNDGGRTRPPFSAGLPERGERWLRWPRHYCPFQSRPIAKFSTQDPHCLFLTPRPVQATESNQRNLNAVSFLIKIYPEGDARVILVPVVEEVPLYEFRLLQGDQGEVRVHVITCMCALRVITCMCALHVT